MHIPDGYLSLQTSIPVLGGMIPIWSVAVNKIKKAFNSRQIPLLSLCAAFSFVIMMFNIPLGPSSVHAVGAVFIAILLGPWAACIAISVALAIQALVFGDGGILAIGVNCLNMAFIMPFAGYYVYKAISGKCEMMSKRNIAGIFAGSYIGINLAALLAAVEFGIQPILFKTAGGIPEYGFYPLAVSVPAMMAEHLLVAGPIEAVITVSALAYLVRFSPYLLNGGMNYNSDIIKKKTFLSRYKAVIIGFAVIIAATPAGLLATGTAWGEWGGNEIRSMLGYIPAGFEKLSGLWKSLIPDYSIKGLGGSFFGSSLGYVISAVVGVVLIIALILLSGKLMVKKDGT
jgi:cobalt/nickel transport system permease protein